MSTRRHFHEGQEDGFTLIELLVVVIIIGILAAIAIPAFLAQRTKGYNAGVKSDLRNAATAEEAWLTDNPTYTANLSDLTANGFRTTNGVTVDIAYATAQGYCMVGHSNSAGPQGGWYLYDSNNGGSLQGAYSTATVAEGACTVTGVGSWATVY